MWKYVLTATISLILGLAIGVRLAHFPEEQQIVSSSLPPEVPRPNVSNLRSLEASDVVTSAATMDDVELTHALYDLQTVPLYEGSRFAGYQVLWVREGSVWSKHAGVELGDVIAAEPGQSISQAIGIIKLWDHVQQATSD